MAVGRRAAAQFCDVAGNCTGRTYIVKTNLVLTEIYLAVELIACFDPDILASPEVEYGPNQFDRSTLPLLQEEMSKMFSYTTTWSDGLEQNAGSFISGVHLFFKSTSNVSVCMYRQG